MKSPGPFVVYNRTRDVAVAANVRLADTPRSRRIGLLQHETLPSGDGLWIYPTQAIHTFGMRFPIDVVFLDRHMRVKRVYHRLAPFRLTRLVWGARSVLELASGSLAGTGTAVGDELQFLETAAAFDARHPRHPWNPRLNILILVTILMLASSCVHRTVGSQSFGLPKAQESPDASLRATFRQQTGGAFNPLADDARVQALQARLTLNSQDVAARLELAAVYEGYRLYEDATQQYRQALALATGPLAEQAVLGLGRCTRASRRPEQAIPLLEAFSKESPSASAWNELGLLYESTGYVMTAERALREAVALDAQSYRLHNNLGYNLLLQKRAPEAEGEFRKALELNPNSAITRNNLGAALAQRGDLEGALEQFQWAADGATAHNNLAVVLLEMGRYEQSREELVKALAIRRNFAPALENFKLVQERIRNRNQRTENEKVLDSLLDRN